MATTRDNSWDVAHIAPRGGYQVQVFLTNHYTGDESVWTLDYHSFRDPRFVARRYTFHRAVWADGAREVFNRIVRIAKRSRS